MRNCLGEIGVGGKEQGAVLVHDEEESRTEVEWLDFCEHFGERLEYVNKRLWPPKINYLIKALCHGILDVSQNKFKDCCGSFY